MYNLVAILTGMTTAIMVVTNGQLTESLDMYRATALVHAIALVTQSLVVLARRTDLRFRKGLPIWCYLGGSITLITIMFASDAFAHLGVAPVVALNLLGMSVTSVLIDQFGWFGMKRYPLTWQKAASIVLILAGVLLLLLPLVSASLLASAMAFITGITAVISRTLNARVLAFYNLHFSTLLSYFTGFITSILLVLIFASKQMFSVFPATGNWFMYTGGIFGVIVVGLTSIIVVRLPSYNVTVLTFLGQYFFGMVIDYHLGIMPNIKGVLGGLIILAGLLINQLRTKRQTRMASNL